MESTAVKFQVRAREVICGPSGHTAFAVSSLASICPNLELHSVVPIYSNSYFIMHLWQATVPFCLLAAAALPGAAATAWGFTDATLSLQHKGSGVNGGFKEQ
jgi:hypothetical protein